MLNNEILAKSQNNIWYYEIELNSLENNEKSIMKHLKL